MESFILARPAIIVLWAFKTKKFLAEVVQGAEIYGFTCSLPLCG